MMVSVLPLGDDENGEASEKPIPEPSATMIAVAAMAVSAPAITALQDRPLQPIVSHAFAVSTTVMFSPAKVVSAIAITPLESVRWHFSDDAAGI